MKRHQFLKESWALIKPYWVSEEKKKAYLMLAICIILNFGFVYASVLLNYWSRDIYDALQNLNQVKFFKQVLYFFPLVLLLLSFFVSKNYIEARLSFNWRQWLTKNCLGQWVKGNIYYHVMNSKEHVDNPDQRISNDLHLMPVQTLNLFITFIKEIVNVITFGTILWGLSKALTFSLLGWSVNIPGYLIWAALLYSALGSGIMVWVGKPLVKLDFLQERYEANFRSSLIRLQERKEEIAIYEGAFNEKKNLNKKFSDIRENFYEIIKRKMYINTCLNIYGNFANLFPILVASPMYFAGALTLGNLIQISSAFGQVKDSFSIIVDNFTMLASLRASMIRLADLQGNIDKANNNIQKNKISINDQQKDDLVVEGLSICKPNGELLKDKINFALKPKDRMIIKGKSGAGKSTMVRALKGLWNYGEGKISMPKDKKIMFVAQRPYMPIASLEDVIAYPMHEISKPEKQQIISYMEKFNLGHLISSLDKHKDWINVLSLGEQQRVSIIRALINNPDILILDEPTTSLDKQSEENVFAELFGHFKDRIMVCVSHSDRFDKQFNKVLKI